MGLPYEIIILGDPEPGRVDEVEQIITDIVSPFDLELGTDVGWHVSPSNFTVEHKSSTVGVFFGSGKASSDIDLLNSLMQQGTPILPVLETMNNVQGELPDALGPFNCVSFDHDSNRVATAILECVGLLPRQRRVFLSYRRNESRDVALQLYDMLCGKGFDVFLDTHDVAPAEDFQAVLWHNLCDSDVLLMLDSPTYFESRWTTEEFGRALAKGVSVLRLGWPDTTPSGRVTTSSQIDLSKTDFDAKAGTLSDDVLDKIASKIEVVRSQSYAVRLRNLTSTVQDAVTKLGGTISGVGINHSILFELPGGTKMIALPSIGVPTSVNLQDVYVARCDRQPVVAYDHIGLHERWQSHLDWLGEHITTVRWVKMSEAAWQFAGMEA